MGLPATDFLTWSIGAGNNAMDQADFAANPAQAVGVQVGIADPTLYNKVTRQSAFVTSTLAMLMAAVLGTSPADDGNQVEFSKNLWETFLGASYFVDSGAVNLWACADTYALGFDAPFAGMKVSLRVAETITQSPTFSFMGHTPAVVAYSDGSLLLPGDVAAGSIVELTFDSSDHWQLTAGSATTSNYRLPIVLTADTTFYFGWTTGNDTTGNGTLAAPFKTLAGAYNYVVGEPSRSAPGLYAMGFTITLEQISTETVPDPNGLLATMPVLGVGPAVYGVASGLYVVLSAGIDTSTAVAGIAAVGAGVRLFISGTGTITVTGTGSYGLQATQGGFIYLAGTSGSYVTLGPATQGKMFASGGGDIFINGHYGDYGAADFHWATSTGGQIVIDPQTPAVVHASGSVVYSGTFAQSISTGVITYLYSNLTFSTAGGSWSSPNQWVVTTAGGIDSGGGGAGDAGATLPGTASNTTTAPGWVN